LGFKRGRDALRPCPNIPGLPAYEVVQPASELKPGYVNYLKNSSQNTEFRNQNQTSTLIQISGYFKLNTLDL